MWKKKSKLNVKILTNLLIFSVLILSFLWAFQVLFIGKFYKLEKTNQIKTVANNIISKQNEEEFNNYLETISLDKEVCVTLTNDQIILYESQFFGKGCMKDDNLKKRYLKQFIDSNKQEMMLEINNNVTEDKTLLYAIKLSDERYIFVNTSINPIDSTTQILIKQLIIVTIIVLLLSIIVSYFMSKHLSDPIIRLNDQTKSIAKGDFSKEFNDNSNILELNELANTLNYTRTELSKTEEYRRDLMANVSHDLKTPLTMIKAYAEMAQDLHSKDKKKQKEDMDIIISETDRLTLLVEDILDLSKMQSDMEKIKKEEFDLIPVINEIIKRYSCYQETENYKFIFNHEEDSLMIEADKQKLEQVIYNLINNAINYTGEDNKITVNIKEKNNNIRVEVQDTGKGIKEEDIPYIWDRYYKNKKKHKRNLVGTGLGLSIVKNILELHHYPYGVESKLNEGSTFYFEIPKKK